MELEGQRLSILGFIAENKLQNEKGDKLDFYDRPFLLDPLCDMSRFQAFKKAAQAIGMSVSMTVKTYYCAENEGWGFIHNFPTDGDASSFVKTKVNKILSANKVFSGIDSNSIELKIFGDRPIHYQGTGSKSGAVSKTVDVIIEDEKDRSDQNFLKELESRTIDSSFKGRWSLSNPSVEGFGIDADWQISDKKEWLVTCAAGHKHPMTWPDSVDVEKQQFICSECKIPLTDDQRRFGAWYVNGDPNTPWTGKLDPKYKISGWHMTLLFVPKISAAYIIEQWNEGKNIEYFHNFILGEPYSPGDTKIERHAILDNWTPKNIITGNYFLGVDVGNVKHFVLGSEKGIVQVGTFTEWHKLDELIMRYSPTTVMDAMPENTMAHHYKDTYPNFFINHFTQDKENNSFIRWGEKDKKGLVFSDRSRLIDRFVAELLEGKILFSLPSDRDFRDYVKHCGDLRRVKDKNNMGIERYVWDSLTGEDHFLFASLYWWIAKQTFVSGATGFLNDVQAPKSIIEADGGFKSNLAALLEHREIYGRDEQG